MKKITPQMIKDSHPLKTGRHDLYAEAMELVGERHAKHELVNLVCFLLGEIDEWEKRC